MYRRPSADPAKTSDNLLLHLLLDPLVNRGANRDLKDSTAFQGYPELGKYG